VKPLTSELAATLQQVAADHGTPVFVYGAAVMRAQVAKLKRFDTIRFAQKACSNIHVLRLLRQAGALVDCVSLGELERALAAGFDPRRSSDAEAARAPAEIVYTADVIDRPTLARVAELGVPVNAGSEDMLEQLGAYSPGHRVWLRVNPGFGHGHSKKVNTGGESSKHGIWHENVPRALAIVRERQLELVGLHMHIGSGADMAHLSRVCEAMVSLVQRTGADVRAISGGGGLSIPYRVGEAEIDPDAYFERWDAARQEIEATLGHAVELEIEPGRYLVAASGYLVAEVRAVKTMGGSHFTLVDAGFNDLVRPAMYGAYHDLELIGAGLDVRPTQPTVVAGPLCESGDVFTQTSSGDVEARTLPQGRVGDLLVVHDAGAYAASMSSNYNSRPLVPEVLLDDGAARLIRRRQTLDELLALEAP